MNSIDETTRKRVERLMPLLDEALATGTVDSERGMRLSLDAMQALYLGIPRWRVFERWGFERWGYRRTIRRLDAALERLGTKP